MGCPVSHLSCFARIYLDLEASGAYTQKYPRKPSTAWLNKVLDPSGQQNIKADGACPPLAEFCLLGFALSADRVKILVWEQIGMG